MKLDKFDHAILDIVSENNQLTHFEIAQKVHLSPSSVRRRLIELRKSGVIIKDVSVLSSHKMGLSFIVNIWSTIESIEKDMSLKNMLRDDPAVSQCYSVSGDLDYIIIVHAVSPQDYEKWAEKNLLSNPLIARFTSTLVWSRTKFSTQVHPYSEG